MVTCLWLILTADWHRFPVYSDAPPPLVVVDANSALVQRAVGDVNICYFKLKLVSATFSKNEDSPHSLVVLYSPGADIPDFSLNASFKSKVIVFLTAVLHLSY
jgi:hypothetical protein